MFIPFIFTLDPANDNYYLWIFYKFLNVAKKYNWPIIAQEKYFSEQPTFIGSKFAETKEEVAENFEYDVPTLEDIYKIQQYPISRDIEKRLINEHGSQTAAWLYLVKERSKYFEDYINEIIDDIITKNKESIEGIFTFCDIPSLTYLAEKRNIAVLQFEWGPFRRPVYRKTAYLNLNRANKRNDLESRYNKFRNEMDKTNVCFLSRKEILAMLLDYKFIKDINLIDCKPQYEMGIACTYTMDLIMFANSSFLNNLELITMIKRYYNDNVLSIRFHPGDPAKAKPSDYLVDDSATPMEFINRCKRIAVVSSNMAFEAMLLGRTTYVLGSSPYAFKAKTDLSSKEESVVELEFINYVIFSYLIPYELMLDVDYLRWRLTNPSECEIYNYNLNYYLSCRGINRDVLEENGINRLKKMLLDQGFDLSGQIISNKESDDPCINSVNDKFTDSMQINKRVQYLKGQINILKIKYQELEEKYEKQVFESTKLWDVHQGLVRDCDNLSNLHKKLIEEYKNKCDNYEKLVKEHKYKCEEFDRLYKESSKFKESHQSILEEHSKMLNSYKIIKQQYETILNSTSWKVTAPIRHFIDKVKNR